MHAATIAHATGPRVPRKPRVFQCGDAGLPTAEGPGKNENGEPDALRILERKLAVALVEAAVLFTGHAVETPGAKPVVGRVAPARAWAGLGFRFPNLHGGRFSAAHCLDQQRHRHQSARKIRASPCPTSVDRKKKSFGLIGSLTPENAPPQWPQRSPSRQPSRPDGICDRHNRRPRTRRARSWTRRFSA